MSNLKKIEKFKKRSIIPVGVSLSILLLLVTFSGCSRDYPKGSHSDVQELLKEQVSTRALFESQAWKSFFFKTMEDKYPKSYEIMSTSSIIEMVTLYSFYFKPGVENKISNLKEKLIKDLKILEEKDYVSYFCLVKDGTPTEEAKQTILDSLSVIEEFQTKYKDGYFSASNMTVLFSTCHSGDKEKKTSKNTSTISIDGKFTWEVDYYLEINGDGDLVIKLKGLRCTSMGACERKFPHWDKLDKE